MNKRLTLSRKDRVIAGVAGGIGEYLDIDPVLIRIAFVVATFAGGIGILAYIIAWLIIPEQPLAQPMSTPSEQTGTPETPPPAPETAKQHPPERRSVVGGLVLIVLGLLFLADNFFPSFRFVDYWPLILVAIGIGLLYKAARSTQS